jgi:mRNA-degrading endonuclease toxin of MazEF toxin-antitoxin module
MSLIWIKGVGYDTVIFKQITVGGSGVHVNASVTAAASGAGTLEVFDAIQGELGLAAGIIQHHVLGVAVAAQGHEGLGVAFPYSQGVANATLGHTVAAPGETQAHVLNIVLADQGHTATPVVLVKNLLEANASQGHTADTGFVVKPQGVANATMGHTADPAAGREITQSQNLTVVSDTQGHDGLAVAMTSQAAGMGVANADQPHTATPVVLVKNVIVVSPTQGHTATPGIFPLSVGPATMHPGAFPAPRLTQINVLGVANATLGNVAGG